MLGCQEAAGRERPVEHAEHFDPLQRLEVEQHVLAQDQRISIPDFPQRQKIVPLKRDPAPDVVDHAIVPGLVSRFEILLQDAIRQTRQLVFRVHGGLDHLGKLAGALHIGGVDAEVVEGETVHFRGKHDRERVRLLPHCRAGVPDTGAAPARNAGEDVLHHSFQYLLVSEEESEGHLQNLPPSGRGACFSIAGAGSGERFPGTRQSCRRSDPPFAPHPGPAAADPSVCRHRG